MSGRRIVQRGWNRALHIHHIVMAKLVEFAGSDAGLHKWRDVVQDFGAQTAGDAHPGNIVTVF